MGHKQKLVEKLQQVEENLRRMEDDLLRKERKISLLSGILNRRVDYIRRQAKIIDSLLKAWGEAEEQGTYTSEDKMFGIDFWLKSGKNK